MHEPWSCPPERHAELTEELFVASSLVSAVVTMVMFILDLVDLVEVDLGEDDLFFEAQV
jgi:hypothetical protein